MTALDDQILDLMRRVSERAILPRYRNLAAGEVEDKGGNDQADSMATKGIEDFTKDAHRVARALKERHRNHE